MQAMILEKVTSLTENPAPLSFTKRPLPTIGEEEILVKIRACGLCHTELDEIEGRTPPRRFPVIPGHQIIGDVVKRGEEVKTFEEGDRVGIGWIYSSCQTCDYCKRGLENLCQGFLATGRDVDGGYAEFMAIHEKYAFPIPPLFSHIEAAPLLCAGSIGYRSLELAKLEDGDPIGLTGFGASGHLVLKLVEYLYPKSRIHVFARREETQEFAQRLGAHWVGTTTDKPKEPLQAIIDTTPAWGPILAALNVLRPGGRLVINAIRKEDRDHDVLRELSYQEHLWMEREIKSVANVTRRDIGNFLELAGLIPIKPETTTYPLKEANQALMDLKEGRGTGAKVLVI